MFIYHYKVKDWFVYSCPGSVILISLLSLRKSTEAISYINHGEIKIIQRRRFTIYGNIVKRKKPTLKYIIPILRGIADNRYRIISEYSMRYGDRGVILKSWEERILVDVGFYE